MSERRKNKTLVQAALDQVADPDNRRAIAERAADTASQIATDLAKKSVVLGSQIGDRAGEVAHTISDEGHAALAEHVTDLKRRRASGSTAKKAKKPRKHRLRRAALLTGTGAVAAYFLDPDNGSRRREAARRRTSTSAQAVGDGLAVAAQVAHHTAEVTSVDHAASVDGVA